jgi:hypothetical protein
MTVVRLDCNRITDWESFHAVFAEVFGFPDFYGRNMNAWIDCMGYLDEPGAGMSAIHVPAGEVVTLHLDGVDEFAARCPEQYAALIECAGFVNWRRSSAGDGAVLALAFYKQAEPAAAPDRGRLL